ncbi:SMI1/KNR4 family protein [Carnobacterium gallinarum]|uniref:SMI1/KNR4 family protein n=1 Tax=Carnobacterium gallinarum TaxID=2749 RepID=UPI00055930FA|nr:SMI1/KNR4 family protein [Carnobacterium gallinarum]
MFRAKEDSILPAPTEKLIEDVEKYYRMKLPLTYKSFLNNYNGVIPITNTFKVEGNEYIIERFLSLLGDEINESEYGWTDIEVVISQISERLTNDGNQIGKKIIPIGALFAGDFVCLDYRTNPEQPCISIWYHAESDEFSPITKWVADDFDSFIGLLK